MNLPSASFVEQAAAFHGHLGPYLVLGLRMGILATALLDSDPFNIEAEVHTLKGTPYSCLLDGIQFSSGCTLGKGNIHVREDEEIYGIFSRGFSTMKIRIRKEVLDSIPKVPREELEPYARDLYTRRDEELFDVVS